MRRVEGPTPDNLDAYTGESSHGATTSVYAHDPDGNEFELMWMLPRARWSGGPESLGSGRVTGLVA